MIFEILRISGFEISPLAICNPSSTCSNADRSDKRACRFGAIEGNPPYENILQGSHQTRERVRLVYQALRVKIFCQTWSLMEASLDLSHTLLGATMVNTNSPVPLLIPQKLLNAFYTSY